MLPRGFPRVWATCIVAAALCAGGCTPHFDKPTLKVTKVDFRGGNLLQQDFLVTFDIFNPNGRSLPVAGLDAQLRVDGETIATGASERAFAVPAHGDQQFDMMIHADMATGLLRVLGHHDALPYELTGNVRIDLPFFRALQFHENGTLPLGGASR